MIFDDSLLAWNADFVNLLKFHQNRESLFCPVNTLAPLNFDWISLFDPNYLILLVAPKTRLIGLKPNFCPKFLDLTASFTPTSKVSWKVEAFSLCMFLLLPTLREVPHGTKGTGPKFVTRPVYSRSQLRNNTNTVSVLVLLMHLFHTLYTRYAGIAHHRALQTSGRGWADSKAVHGMECSGARSLYWRSLSAGAAA